MSLHAGDPAARSVLARVEHPSRYVSPEFLTRRKTFVSRVSFAFAFPDTYEIGMSHLGGKILYEIVNAVDGLVMERAFCPWPDMEKSMRERSIPLGTLESGTPLSRFDVVGFSIQHELTLTNVLTMLDLGGIPLLSSERGDADPIVIAGGPGAFNPEPFADFVDAVFVGEAEEALSPFLARIGELRGRGAPRKALIEAMAGTAGIYVPALHPLEADRLTSRLAPQRVAGIPWPIERRIVLDLDAVSLPLVPVVPSSRVVHDRYTAEISRGCQSGCRFCQAGVIYRPVRERSPESILNAVRRAVASTGLTDVSFSSLSAGDYSRLEELFEACNDLLADGHVSLSISSIRPAALTARLARAIRKVRKTGFTIAAEAASQRLRDVINKNVTDREILEGILTAYEHGWDAVKIYFMMGLPTETREEVLGIGELARGIQREARRAGFKGKGLSVSVATFVPKPHTPFEREGMMSLSSIDAAHRDLARSLGPLGSRFKWHSPESSILEAAFARGDRRLGRVLLGAWRSGARMDGWSDRLALGVWRRAFEAEKIDMEAYLEKIPAEAALPWEHIGTGVDRRFLNEESRRAAGGERTDPCEFSNCAGCGVCPPAFIRAESRKRESAPGSILSGGGPTAVGSERAGGTDGKPETGPRAQAPETAPVYRVRVKFRKEAEARYLSHLELLSTMGRIAMRAGLPLSWSRGFHPMARLSFGPALPVGTEGLDEYVDIHLTRCVDAGDIVFRMNASSVAGIVFEAARPAAPNAASLSAEIRRARYRARPLVDPGATGARGSGVLNGFGVPEGNSGTQNLIQPGDLFNSRLGRPELSIVSPNFGVSGQSAQKPLSPRGSAGPGRPEDALLAAFDGAAEVSKRLMAGGGVLVERSGKDGRKRIVDIGEGILEVDVRREDRSVRMLLTVGAPTSARPEEVLRLLFGPDGVYDIVREEAQALQEGTPVSPLSAGALRLGGEPATTDGANRTDGPIVEPEDTGS